MTFTTDGFEVEAVTVAVRTSTCSDRRAEEKPRCPTT